MKVKDSWQKLNLEYKSKVGKISIYLNVLKKKASHLFDLNGYVIFAKPKVNRISLNQNSECICNWNTAIINDTLANKINFTDRIAQKILITKADEEIKNKNYLKAIRIYREAYEFDLDNQYSKLQIDKYFNSKQLNSQILAEKQKIRNKLSENKDDKKIYEAKEDSWVKKNDNLGGRINRWKKSLKYFLNYNIEDKFFGNGFNYHYDFIVYDTHNNKKYDYPHNPFISSLLYSGIIGAIFLFLYIGIIGFLYLKYSVSKNISGLYIVTFFITFIFSTISGNSIFSIPILNFLLILPFIYYAIDDKLHN